MLESCWNHEGPREQELMPCRSFAHTLIKPTVPVLACLLFPRLPDSASPPTPTSLQQAWHVEQAGCLYQSRSELVFSCLVSSLNAYVRGSARRRRLQILCVLADANQRDVKNRGFNRVVRVLVFLLANCQHGKRIQRSARLE